MTEIIAAEAISRRKALALFGLATAALVASSVVAAPEAEAQTVGMERRQEIRGGCQDRRQARRTGPRRGVKKTPVTPIPTRRRGHERMTCSALPAWLSPFWRRETASALP